MFYLHHLFRSFLPLHNPIGFGAADFIELAIASLLVGFALVWRRWIEYARRLASKTVWCMLVLTSLPIVLRLFLLPVHPIPSPGVADDYSYLLLADTLSHFRLANPPHLLNQFFETFFVLQEPTYSSVYPLGQGLAMAFGQIVFRLPWAGVAISVGLFCGLCYWMLRAWMPPLWALLGGLLAVIEFGPLNQWMNSYWGGAVSAIAGCLVFGALPRIRESRRVRDAILLGLGLGIQLLSRPYESLFLFVAVGIFFMKPVPGSVKLIVPAVLTVFPFITLTLVHNKEVTGTWTTLPNALSRYQYGIPAAFTFQPNPVPHRSLTREQQLDYDIQSKVHGSGTDTPGRYLNRLLNRIRFYRFFILAPLYLVLPIFLLRLREFRFTWVVLTLLMFSLGANLYPYLYSHYIAAVTCLMVLVGLSGIQWLSSITIRGYPTGAEAARVIIFLCFAHFAFWYGLHLFGKADFAQAMWNYETWDAINYGDPEGRIAINGELRHFSDKQLVFVRYSSSHSFKEWVFNAANIDDARVVWARDLGMADNEALRRYFPDRTAWLLEPDARPPKLTRYLEPNPSKPDVAPTQPPPSLSHPKLKFEEVR
jgi:hypothetical protein